MANEIVRGALAKYIASVLVVLPCTALFSDLYAASDEIQVYLDDVDARGQHSLELHLNYVPRGRFTPEYPGEQPPAHVFRATPEFSLGLGDNWDWGLYLPTSFNADSGSLFDDGFKLRLKHVISTEVPGGSNFYGANIEIARASRRTSPNFWRAELRTMLGMRRGPWLFAMNPILSTPLSSSVGMGESSVDLELAFKVARDVSDGIALGVEHYSEIGPVRRPVFGSESGETTFAVLDWAGKKYDLNFGIGHGWTQAADRYVVKAIVGLPF